MPITQILVTEYDCLLPEELNSFYYKAKFSTVTFQEIKEEILKYPDLKDLILNIVSICNNDVVNFVTVCPEDFDIIINSNLNYDYENYISDLI